MLKRIVLLLIVSLLISSCSQKEISIEYLVKRNGITYEINKEEPFSGIVYKKLPNGQFILKGRYKNGYKDGEWIEYFDNGQIALTGLYKSGNRDGEWIKYYDNGQIAKTETFINGRLEGNYVCYYENGNKDTEGIYNRNKKFGKWISYYSNKLKKSEQKYVQNKLVYYKDWNESGKLVSERNYPGIHYWYNANEEKAASIEYKDGEYIQNSLSFWFKVRQINAYSIINKNWKYYEGHHEGFILNGSWGHNAHHGSYDFYDYYYFMANGKFFHKESKDGGEIVTDSYYTRGHWWIDMEQLPKFRIKTKIYYYHERRFKYKNFTISYMDSKTIIANGKKWTKENN